MRKFVLYPAGLILAFCLGLLFFNYVFVAPVCACEPRVSIDEITPIIELSPTDVVPVITEDVSLTATPEASEAAPVFSGQNDGHSDGKSDGHSSCPECTQPPVVPQGPPATGR